VFAPLRLVAGAARFLDQSIQLCIHVTATVGPMGWKPLTVKRVKNIRILIPTQPAQGIYLESALRDTGKESSELEAPYLQRYAHLAQFLLQNHRHQPAGLIRRCLHCQPEANPALPSLPSRGIE